MNARCRRRRFIALLAAWALPLAADESPPEYRITVDGPQVALSHACDDPCRLERIRVVGKVGMQAETHDDVDEPQRPIKDAQGICIRHCGKRGSGLKVRAPRELKEGLELTIEDRWAHFIFYSVTETESGPATRRKHYEFQIDRPEIRLTLGDNEVEVLSAVEAGPGLDRRP